MILEENKMENETLIEKIRRISNEKYKRVE